MDNKAISIQKLNGQNFYMWKFKIELLLQRDKLWSTINQDPPAPLNDEWTTRDQAAKATICLAIEDNLLINVRSCTTAKDTWITLNKIYEHPSLSSKLHLLRKLYSTRYEHYNRMRDFVNAILEIVGQLRNMGETTNDKNIIAVMLCGLPTEYNNLITAIESKDEDEITLDYVKIKLFDEADRRENPNFENTPDTMAMPSFRHMDRYKTITCFGCGQTGHTKRQCYKENNRNFAPRWRPPYSTYQPQSNSWEGNGNNNRDIVMTTSELNNCQEGAHHSAEDTDYTMNFEHCQCENRDNHTALSGNIGPSPNHWILDSGASAHMTGNKFFFQEITYMKEDIPITMANGNTVFAKGRGNGLINIDNDIKLNDSVKIHNILFVPQLKFQLISIKQLCNRGHRVNFEGNTGIITNNNRTIATAHIKGGSFVLSESHHNKQSAHPCIHMWHDRLGHRSQQNLRETTNQLLPQKMKPDKCQHNDFCRACQLGKMQQKTFKTSTEQTTTPFHTIVTDICGPIQEKSLGGNSYILTMTDRYSRYLHVDIIKYKSDATDKLKQYIEKGHNKFGYYPVILRSDGGSEFVNKQLDDYLVSKGITHQVVVPYTPQQNGQAERINSTLMNMSRCLLKHSGLPSRLWGEAVNTSAYTINRLIHSSTGQTPYERWNGKKPNLTDMKTFGCQAYGYHPRPLRRKLDDTATEGIFVGYGLDTKGFRLWLPKVNKIIVVSKITCDEKAKFSDLQTNEASNHHTDYIPIQMSEPDSENTVDDNDTQLRRSQRPNKGIPPQKLTY